MLFFIVFLISSFAAVFVLNADGEFILYTDGFRAKSKEGFSSDVGFARILGEVCGSFQFPLPDDNHIIYRLESLKCHDYPHDQQLIASWNVHFV